MQPDSPSVAALLESIANGDDSAAEVLFPLVYDELHRLASRLMNSERKDHTLQATALINEAFLKLARPHEDSAPYQNEAHFIATAAVVMRRILVNHAKARKAEKRGGGAAVWQLDEVTQAFDRRAVDLVALDHALETLKERDEQQHRIVELRFFGGLTVAQCAQLLGLSERAVYYEWSHARAWLRSQLEQD